jgi:hypothetical protein
MERAPAASADAFQALARFMRAYRAGAYPDIDEALASLPEERERELFARLVDCALQCVVPPPPTPEQVAEFRALLRTFAEGEAEAGARSPEAPA